MINGILLLLALISAPCVYAAEISDIDRYLYPEEADTISMDFRQASLAEVLKILSQQSGLNFIAAADVAGKRINLYLDKVPVEEALERILFANDLTYETRPGSNVLIVKTLKKPTKEVITRVYHLKYATVPSSKMNSTLSAAGTGGASTAGGGGGIGGSSGIVGAIKAILTPDGAIIEDSRTNSLIISDIPSQFPVIEQTIARLDVRIPQILIDVEMLDISKTTADLLGAKFGDTPATFFGAQRDTLIPFDRNKAMQNFGKIGGQGFEFEDPEFRVGTLSFAGLKTTLNFLRTRSDTKNLARPRILTLDNETAQIEIKTDEAIGLSSVTTAAEGTGTTVAQAERVLTGVFLKVTPQVNTHTQEITMAVEPKVVQARTGGTFGSSTFKDPEERSTKSILRIRDGDTIVIGGLLRTNVEETKTRVPILGDIPFLGAAFRHKDKTESERELIIFITPHIIQEDLVAVPLARLDDRRPVSPQRLNAIDNELSRIEKQRQ